MVVANLDPRNARTYSAGFPTGGTWYRYNGDPMVDGTTLSSPGNISLDSSEVFLFTSFPLDSCNAVSKKIDAMVPNTLRTAIDCAIDGDTIQFMFPVENDTIKLSSSLTINKHLVIEAKPGQDIIIDGSSVPNDAIIIPSGKSVELIGVKIKCNGNDCIDISGQLTIKNTELKTNSP